MRKIGLLLVIVFITSVSFSNVSKKTGIREVKVIITPSLEKEAEKFYTLIPLKWEDFSGVADSSSEWAALTHSGIRLRYEYQERPDTTIAKVMLFPYMDRNRSWYKPEGYNNYTLAHEQRHFDITAIVTNELAREIRKTDFNLIDFPTAIIMLHGKYIRKLEQMQTTYDEETAHGDNYHAQQRWNEEVSKEVAALGIYK
jgi:hypothetical protein